MFTISRISAAVLCAALLAACGGKDATELTASAREYLAKGDAKSAIIQLKSALQKEDSGETRFLLGSALLDTGDLVGAAVELEKARAQGFDEARISPVLAQALVGTGKAKEAIEQFGTAKLADPQDMARLKTSLALAHTMQRDLPAAQSAIDAAVAAVPGHAPALVLRARILAASRDADGAMRLIEDVLAQHPKDSDAWQTKGEILASFRNDPAAAAQAYAEAIKLRPAAIGAHVGLVSLAMARKDWPDAEQKLEQMRAAVGNAPQGRFLSAQLALGKGDLKAAGEHVNQLLKIAPNHPAVLQLAGTYALQSGAHLQAQGHLSKLLQMAPQNRVARTLLAQSYARSGQAAKALATIEPQIGPDSNDAAALSIAGEAYMQEGDMAKAETAFSRAAAINPEDQRSRTALAVVNLNKGNFDAGFGELESIASSDKGTSADLTLISAHLRQRQFDKALVAIDHLAKKTPDRPTAPYLRGLAHLGQKQEDKARASFEAALKADPHFFAAVAQLAALDLRAGQASAAQDRFRAVIKAVPGHVEASIALVQLLERARAPREEMVTVLAEAIKANPTVVSPRLRLVALHLAANEGAKALTAAQDAAVVMPDHPGVVEALGGAQFAAGERHQAVASFNKLASMRADSPIGALRLTDLYLAEKDLSSARQAANRAKSIAPDAPEVYQRLVAVELADGRHDAAVALAREVQKRNPKRAGGFVLQGDIEGARGDWAAAANAYRAGLKVEPVNVVAIKLYGALLRANQAAEAQTMSRQWMAQNPRDMAFLGYMADSTLARKDFDGAARLYESVLKEMPDNARVLNNLAWLRLKTDPAGALELARKADKLLPDSPPLMDTLGQALLANQRADEAVKVLAEALRIDPKSHAARLTLARAHIALGQKDQARGELERLSQAGDKVPEAAEAAGLLKTL